MGSEEKISFITDSDFEKLLDNLAEKKNVYIPQAVTNCKGGTYFHYELRSSGEKFTYYGY